MTGAAPIILVSGFGRCGTSMAMQMLDAAGMRTSGEHPAFEHDSALISNFDAAWISSQAGTAVKVLHLQSSEIFIPLRATGARFRVVWCHRDPVEQAKSHVKFIHMTAGLGLNRRDRKRLERSLHTDRPLAIRRAQALGPLHLFSFEYALRAPRLTALDLLSFCGLDTRRAARAAAIVRPRPIQCAPGFHMEAALIDGRPARAADA